MQIFEALRGYRTVAFNVLMGLLTAFAIITQTDPTAALEAGRTINTQIDAALLVLTGIWTAGGVILRYVTTTPIFKKG